MSFKSRDMLMLENIRESLVQVYGSISLEHEKPPSSDPDCPKMVTFVINRTKLLDVTIHYGFQKIFLTLKFYREDNPYKFLSSMTNCMEENVEFIHCKTTVENKHSEAFSTIQLEYDYSELLMKDLTK